MGNVPTNKYVSSLANLGQIGRCVHATAQPTFLTRHLTCTPTHSAQVCFFAGLVTCSVANAFVTLTIAEEEVAPAADPVSA